MRRFLLTAAVAATALASAACGDTTGVGANVAGSYELFRVNGESLPADDIQGEFTFHAGVLELDNDGSSGNDGSFRDLIQYRFFNDPVIEDSEVFGTWERSGSDVILEYDNGFQTRADRPSNSRLILEDERGNTLEYRRF
jgi:hypothetical protein